MKLYASRNSPFSRKVLLWSHVLGCREQIEYIDLSQSGVFVLPPNYEQINPLRKIPALVTKDHGTFIDSPLICDFLSRTQGYKKFMDQREDLANLQFESVADGICDAGVLRRLEQLREQHLRSQVWDQNQKLKMDNGFGFFEARISQLKNPYDRGELALMCAIAYIDFRFPQENWRSQFPRLQNWYEGCLHWEPFSKTHHRI